MRLGRVKFEISYVVDLDNAEMVKLAECFICDDIAELGNFVISPTLEYCEDRSLKESDIPSSLQEDAADESMLDLDYNFYIDGASRGNPGKAAIGVVVTDEHGTEITKIKEYIGETTNNVAEYKALICALEFAVDNMIQYTNIFSDSELLVKQISGAYKVKDAKLKLLHTEAKKLIKELTSFRITHVKREFNKEADKLCNEVLDEQGG